MDPIKGLIFNIQKFCINDGPGIRTTVFFKGCPLRCLWCHNPESQARRIEISYIADKCIGCGNCLRACPQGCHTLENSIHVFKREHCLSCGKCAEDCYSGALEAIGREVTVDEVMAEVLKDRIFYEQSGGGLTLSGGEPMLQFAFVRELLREAKKHGLHTCLETCGYTPADRFDLILPDVDLFLYDFKETDPTKHRQDTGVSNELIIANLFHIDQAGGKTVLRVPIIPGCNDRPDHFAAIAATANRLRNIQGIDVEPYHPLGKSKSANIGRTYGMADPGFPDEASVERWLREIRALTAVPVKKG